MPHVSPASTQIVEREVYSSPPLRPLPVRVQMNVTIYKTGPNGTTERIFDGGLADDGRECTVAFVIPQSIERLLITCKSNYPRPLPAENLFAQWLVNSMPADIWDACCAAMAIGTAAGHMLAADIYERWWRDRP
jgi:hypothetical protein